MKLRRVHGQGFLMGAEAGTSVQSDQEPVHSVELSYDFFISTHEISKSVYQKVMESGDADPALIARLEDNGVLQGNGDHPATRVSWFDAVKFCEVLNGLDSETRANRWYRLPTEAEWEFCCRAGTATPFSSGEQLSNKIACFRVDNGLPSSGPVRTGSLLPNQFGLYDMHGNVWEWCQDWYREDYYSVSPRLDPPGPPKGIRRVIRGGGWNTKPEYCSSTFRDSKLPNELADYLGFRVVCLTGTYTTPPETYLSDQSTDSVKRSRHVVQDVPSVIADAEPSVVRIDARGTFGAGTGSGFLYEDSSTVITNYHVIEGANFATVEFKDSKRSRVLGVVYSNSESDLAVLKIDPPHTNSQPLRVRSDKPRKGEQVIALGAPRGLSFSATTGIVSALRSHEELMRVGINLGFNVTWVQNTAPISPGNSGGPLVDMSGEVMGINTLIVAPDDTQNVNFAVSAEHFPPREMFTTLRPLRRRGARNKSGAIERFEDALRELENQF